MAAPFTPQQIAALTDLISRGQIPGISSGMNDTYTAAEDCAPTFPLNIRYIIASNVQRTTSARLSFHLAAFRSPVAGVASATTAAAPHVHFWSSGGGIVSGGGSVAVTAGGILGNTGATVFGKQTSSELWNPSPGAGASLDTAIEGFNVTGHTHTVTPTLTYGIFEGAVAAGVTIAFDGVDRTAALGGPWSADVVELDVRQYISTVTGVYHNIALQPTGLGRIESHLRLGSFVDARLTV